LEEEEEEEEERALTRILENGGILLRFEQCQLGGGSFTVSRTVGWIALVYKVSVAITSERLRYKNSRHCRN
jgi:hypothetical protein